MIYKLVVIANGIERCNIEFESSQDLLVEVTKWVNVKAVAVSIKIETSF